MKLQIFYDNGREMDILEGNPEYNTWVAQLNAYLKKENIKPKKVVHGSQVWGWEKTYDAHVITKDVEDYELSSYVGLYPRGAYKLNGGPKVKTYK